MDNIDEQNYLKLLSHILEQKPKGGRNGLTRSLFGPQLEFQLNRNGAPILPLLTTKKMFLKGIVEELLFFIRGNTNTKDLENKGVNIWRGNTSLEFLKSRNLDYKEGDMGPMYGFNWRHFGEGTNYNGCECKYQGYDQLRELIKGLICDPNSRRHILTTFDPSSVDKCVLAPCHGIAIQFYIDDNRLDCKFYMRSTDMFLGAPFNIASYGLLTILIAGCLKLQPGRLIMTMGDAHIYEDHMFAVKTQIERVPYPFPSIDILGEVPNSNVDKIINFLENLQFENIVVKEYTSHPPIKAPLIV